MGLLVSSYNIFTQMFILIPSVILGTSRPYPMGILKWESRLKSHQQKYYLAFWYVLVALYSGRYWRLKRKLQFLM